MTKELLLQLLKDPDNIMIITCFIDFHPSQNYDADIYQILNESKTALGIEISWIDMYYQMSHPGMFIDFCVALILSYALTPYKIYVYHFIRVSTYWYTFFKAKNEVWWWSMYIKPYNKVNYKEFHDLYMENVATFIYNQIELGNVSPEFIEYLNTFLQSWL